MTFSSVIQSRAPGWLFFCVCESSARRNDVFAGCYWALCLPSCGRWSRCVGETLGGMRIDGLVFGRRRPSQPAFFPPFFWACVWEAVHSALCLSLLLTMIRPLLSPCCWAQAGERGEHIQNRGKAAGGEDRAAESGGGRWICHQEAGVFPQNALDSLGPFIKRLDSQEVNSIVLILAGSHC